MGQLLVFQALRIPEPSLALALHMWSESALQASKVRSEVSALHR